MLDFEIEYKQKLDLLRKTIRSAKSFDAAIESALELHAMTHTSSVSASGTATFCDQILDGLLEEEYSVMPTAKDETIAWHIWHIARIEDMVGNLLIAQQSQLFDEDWMRKLCVNIRDTGNVMTDKQIIDFSRQVNKQELLHYRDQVGRQTRKILSFLNPSDLKRKPSPEYLARLVSEGGLLECQGSIWLKNFWGNYTVSGLILLPLTYHHMLHLPDSAAIKKYILNGRNEMAVPNK